MRLIFFISLILSFGYSSEPVASYCDYVSGSTTDSTKTNYYYYTTGNDQEICNSRMLRSLYVLNANFAPAGIQFVLHADFPNMLHATDPGFDGFYENATGGSSAGPSADEIKAHYNIDNALNIYIIDFIHKRDGTSGISTYPWSIGPPGTFYKHGFLPGDIDAHPSAEYDRTFMHEIGHYLGLLHINGTWYVSTDTSNTREFVSENDCNYNGDTICDTPAEPGMSNGAWYTNSNNRECIYHGYGGDYDSIDSTLKIGGYNKYYLYLEGDPNLEGLYPKYNFCEAWGFEDPYGLEHCKLFTNYDNAGDFFGTRNLNPEECNNANQSEYSTECHINNYSYLPIGHNFMRAASSPYNKCGLSPINDNIYFDETKSGFTKEQYANMRYIIQYCYTGCADPLACNFDMTSTHLLRFDHFSNCYYANEGVCDTVDYCLPRSDQMSRSEGQDFFTLSYINPPSDNNLDCATDEVYGNFTDKEWTNLIKIRKRAKKLMKKNLHREQLDTLFIPIVFHNIYKLESLSSNNTLYPKTFKLEIYPNPFNPITTIRYDMNQNANVQIFIYDITGRLIATLINGFQTADYHSIKWDASNFSSGIYFIKLSSLEFTETKKILFIK